MQCFGSRCEGEASLCGGDRGSVWCRGFVWFFDLRLVLSTSDGFSVAFDFAAVCVGVCDEWCH
jgi:hypothetical protein